MIDLYTAIKLCDIGENEIIDLIPYGGNKFSLNRKLYTKKEIFNKLDTRKIKVMKIDFNIDSYTGQFDGFIFYYK